MLTNREQQALKLRQEGLIQTEVADELDISQAAVSSFERNAQRKIEDGTDYPRLWFEKEFTLFDTPSGSPTMWSWDDSAEGNLVRVGNVQYWEWVDVSTPGIRPIGNSTYWEWQ